MSDFVDKVVLIAGALGTHDVGIAKDLRAKGAAVLIAPGRPLGPELITLYAGFIFVDGDITDPAGLTARCDEIKTQHGRLDLVIFCSGTALQQRASDAAVLQAERSARRQRIPMNRVFVRLACVLAHW